jgi:hypothetical protein
MYARHVFSTLFAALLCHVEHDTDIPRTVEAAEKLTLEHLQAKPRRAPSEAMMHLKVLEMRLLRGPVAAGDLGTIAEEVARLVAFAEPAWARVSDRIPTLTPPPREDVEADEEPLQTGHAAYYRIASAMDEAIQAYERAGHAAIGQKLLAHRFDILGLLLPTVKLDPLRVPVLAPTADMKPEAGP